MVIVAALALMFALYFFINRTRTGRAMRAVSEDKDVAAMMGINVDRIIVTTFAIGGVLAGAAGDPLHAPLQPVHFYMGFLPGIKAFTAAVLGGIGNIIGAALGGLLLGVLEQVGPNLLPHRIRHPVAQPAPGRHRLHGARPRPHLPATGLLGRRENAVMGGRFLRRAITTGLLGGLAGVHLSLVGMVTALQSRELIAGVVTIGTVIPFICHAHCRLVRGRT